MENKILELEWVLALLNSAEKLEKNRLKPKN
jgi:hypothetical protein